MDNDKENQKSKEEVAVTMELKNGLKFGLTFCQLNILALSMERMMKESYLFPPEMRKEAEHLNYTILRSLMIQASF